MTEKLSDEVEYRTMANRYRSESEQPHLFPHDRSILSLKGKIVLSFIERWGMVQAVDDGEDSAGRAKVKLMPAKDMVDRAFVIADLAIEEMQNRGWMVRLPGLNDIDAMVERDEKARIEQKKALEKS